MPPLPTPHPRGNAAWAAGSDLLIVLGLLLAAVVAGVVIYRLHFWQERTGPTELDQIFADAHLPLSGDDAEPVVQVRFHTYQGFFVSTTQTEHRFEAPVSRALWILDELHRFNLRSNFGNKGFLWIPPLSRINRAVQRRSILRQARRQGWIG